MYKISDGHSHSFVSFICPTLTQVSWPDFDLIRTYRECFSLPTVLGSVWLTDHSATQGCCWNHHCYKWSTVHQGTDTSPNWLLWLVCGMHYGLKNNPVDGVHVTCPCSFNTYKPCEGCNNNIMMGLTGSEQVHMNYGFEYDMLNLHQVWQLCVCLNVSWMKVGGWQWTSETNRSSLTSHTLFGNVRGLTKHFTSQRCTPRGNGTFQPSPHLPLGQTH